MGDDMQQTAVQYVGARERYKEGCYGSGIEFEKGQTLLVPNELAAKLLRHPDVYAPGEVTVAQPATIPPQDPNKVSDPEVENVRDMVMNMDLDTLSDFSMTHYRVKLHPRQSVGNARKKVLQMIDLYGIT
jgi:hypothetical protein